MTKFASGIVLREVARDKGLLREWIEKLDKIRARLEYPYTLEEAPSHTPFPMLEIVDGDGMSPRCVAVIESNNLEVGDVIHYFGARVPDWIVSLADELPRLNGGKEITIISE